MRLLSSLAIAISIACPALSISAAPALAETVRYTVCYGERESKCEWSYDIHRSCGPTDESIAREICLIRNGPQSPYRAVRLHTKSGGRCGYGMIEVTCFD